MRGPQRACHGGPGVGWAAACPALLRWWPGGHAVVSGLALAGRARAATRAHLAKVGADGTGSMVSDVLPWVGPAEGRGRGGRLAAGRPRVLRPASAGRRRFSGQHQARAWPLEHVPWTAPFLREHEQGCAVRAAERAREAPAVQADRLEHLPALADAHAALIGDVGVPERRPRRRRRCCQGRHRPDRPTRAGSTGRRRRRCRTQ